MDKQNLKKGLLINMAHSYIEEDFAHLQEVKKEVQTLTQKINTDIDQELIHRFFNFLRYQATYGYVDIDFTDPSDSNDYLDSAEALDPLMMPHHVNINDFKPNLDKSSSNGLYCSKEKLHPLAIEQYFVIPWDYFRNPYKWEEDLLQRMKKELSRALDVLLHVFPDLHQSRVNGDIIVNMFLNDYIQDDIILFHLDQRSRLGEKAYQKPLLYNGINYGKTHLCFAYSKSLDALYYNEKGFDIDDTIDLTSKNLTQLSTVEDLKKIQGA